MLNGCHIRYVYISNSTLSNNNIFYTLTNSFEKKILKLMKKAKPK